MRCGANYPTTTTTHLTPGRPCFSLKSQHPASSHFFAISHSASKSTLPQILLLRLLPRTNIKVKDIHRQSQRRAGIRNIDNPSDVALDRGARKEEVDLVVVVAVAAEILNDADAGLAVGDGGVEVELLAVLVDAESLCRPGEEGLLEWGSSRGMKREWSDVGSWVELG